MKKIILILTIIVSGPVCAQPYFENDLGLVFDKHFNAQLPVASLHMGYQGNDILVTDDVVLVEYNQRVLLGSHNPKYIGGRIGYGLATGEFTTVAVWGGYYYRLISGDFKELNYWLPGYGISAVYKRVSFQFMYSEFYQISIGGRILIE